MNIKNKISLLRIKKDLELNRMELEKDRFFVDNWQYSMQISEEIDIIDKKLNCIRNILNDVSYDKKVFKMLLRDEIRAKIHINKRRNSLICKPVTCSDINCNMNCNGICFNCNVLLDKLIINMPDPDSCNMKASDNLNLE